MDEVYRVLVKNPHSDDWYPLINRGGTAFYATPGGAKIAIQWNKRSYRHWNDSTEYEYKIQVSELNWVDHG